MLNYKLQWACMFKRKNLPGSTNNFFGRLRPPENNNPAAFGVSEQTFLPLLSLPLLAPFLFVFIARVA